MIIFCDPIELQELKEKHSDFYEDMVKIVVDLEQKKIAANAELHVDLEQELLEKGSKQTNLWGANIYFNRDDFIEYTSMINIRPSQRNFDMLVQDVEIRKQMQDLISQLIIRK